LAAGFVDEVSYPRELADADTTHHDARLSGRVACGSEGPVEAFEDDPLRKRDTIELVGAYLAIEDATVHQCFRSLAKALVSE
jgi:hypothetical protein